MNSTWTMEKECMQLAQEIRQISFISFEIQKIPFSRNNLNNDKVN